MGFEFHIVDGPGIGRQIQLAVGNEITVGRADVADQSVASDPIMSSLHFKLLATATGCQIEDLASTNGTFVNGRRVTKANLSDGDAIMAGSTTFEVRICQSLRSQPARLSNAKQTNPFPNPETQRMQSATIQDSFDLVSKSKIAIVEFEGPFGVRNASIDSRSRVFGRTPSADITVPDEMISSLHFSLRCDDDGVKLHDLNSSNGTYVDGHRVDATWLGEGATFHAGSTEFRILEIQVAGNSNSHDNLNEVATEVVEASDDERAVASSANLTNSGDTLDAERRLSANTPNDTTTSVVNSHEDPPLVRTQAAVASCRSKWPYELGLSDLNADVRTAALLAAVFSQQPWLLAYCREAIRAPELRDFGCLMILAILGDETDLPAFRLLSDADWLDPIRVRLLASYGHPALVPELLDQMESVDPTTACAAAWAFTRITGHNVNTDVSVFVPLASGDDLELRLPNPKSARAHWAAIAPELDSITRVSNGRILSSSSRNDDSRNDDDLDAGPQSQIETEIRGVYAGHTAPSYELLFRAQTYLKPEFETCLM